MRYGMAVGILAAGLIIGGCGGETSEINKVIGAYGRALAAGDGDRACRLMTAEGRASIVRDNKWSGVRSCRELAPLLKTMATEEELRDLRHLRLKGVKVTGDRAVGQMAEAHALTRTGDARLRRIDGRWLLDDAHPERR